jgi:sigma-B regulation protein RsbU (phosphoserine phosphatase)
VALAGHPPPIALDSGEPVDAAAGMPLGVAVELDCTATTLHMGEGDGLLLYTDGLIEARRPGNGNGDAAREQFGSERVVALLAELRDAPPSRVVSELREAAESFSGGALDDDLCMVALRPRA